MSAVTSVRMPRLSDSMEEGTLSRWLISDGEVVTCGDDLAEIETDKATVTFQAEADGVLTTVIAEGDTVSVGTVIARLGEAPNGPGAAPISSGEDAKPVGTVDADTTAGQLEQVVSGGSRLRASPLARRVAREHDIDLSEITGSGPAGRIVRRDVQARLESVAAGSDRGLLARGDPQAAELVSAGRGQVRTQELTRAQALVARRMVEARAAVPDFEVRVRVDAQPVMDLRERLKVESPDTIPSVNDLVVKASALALREQPQANGAHRGDTWEFYDRVNVGIAVAVEHGLLVPTIMDADRKSVGEIARTSRLLAERARLGALTPAELGDGTFTVSNLGMFGVAGFSSIHFAPQAAILSVGAALPTPVVRDGQVVPGVEMELALACDHRILYGADGARLLRRIQHLLENPLALLIA